MYVYGGFDLPPEEALLIEFQVPKVCRYWSIHLADDLGWIHDWVHRRTIINGHTAVLDGDGWVRIVVSAQDPGTPNWLDTIGFRTGAMSLRLEHCDAYPDGTASQRWALVRSARIFPPRRGPSRRRSAMP